MSGRYPAFDVSRVRLRPLTERKNDLCGDFILPLCDPPEEPPQGLRETAASMLAAQEKGSAVVFLLGAHVLRAGVQNYCFDLMRRGYVQGLAVNGAVAVHDYEIALQNATTESVAHYIRDGRFGLWTETGRINGIVAHGIARGLGFGEALGQELAEGAYPHKAQSLFAVAWQLGIPVTVHVGVGYDIIHAHPNFDGAAVGAASHRDFLIFAELMRNLENGVAATFGSAVMAPEVFLKALSMARNVAVQDGKSISHFTSLVCDLHDLPENPAQEADKNDAHYYFRPWKTLLARTVAGGGRSFYVQGRHAQTIPALWKAINEAEKNRCLPPQKYQARNV